MSGRTEIIEYVNLMPQEAHPYKLLLTLFLVFRYHRYLFHVIHFKYGHISNNLNKLSFI